MKRLARGLELGELALHPVERPREPAELVAGRDVEARGEVALGDPARRALHPLHAARDSARATSTLARIASASAIAAGDEDPLPDELDPALDALELLGEHRDVVDARALRARRGDPQRNGRLGHPAGVARLGAALDPA